MMIIIIASVSRTASSVGGGGGDGGDGSTSRCTIATIIFAVAAVTSVTTSNDFCLHFIECSACRLYPIWLSSSTHRCSGSVYACAAHVLLLHMHRSRNERTTIHPSLGRRSRYSVLVVVEMNAALFSRICSFLCRRFYFSFFLFIRHYFIIVCRRRRWEERFEFIVKWFI